MFVDDIEVVNHHFKCEDGEWAYFVAVKVWHFDGRVFDKNRIAFESNPHLVHFQDKLADYHKKISMSPDPLVRVESAYVPESQEWEVEKFIRTDIMRNHVTGEDELKVLVKWAAFPLDVSPVGEGWLSEKHIGNELLLRFHRWFMLTGGKFPGNGDEAPVQLDAVDMEDDDNERRGEGGAAEGGAVLVRDSYDGPEALAVSDASDIEPDFIMDGAAVARADGEVGVNLDGESVIRTDDIESLSQELFDMPLDDDDDLPETQE